MKNKIKQGSASEHTPTPWVDKAGEIFDAEGHVVLMFGLHTPDVLANRSKVVRAVNAHDELVHAVKFAKNVIDNACGQLSGDEAKRIHSMMTKALAKAEGK